MEQILNLQLPGNPRYQPKDLIKVFGYDYLYRPYVEVELAVLETLGELGIIPAEDLRLLNDDVRKRLMAITTTEVDEIERKITKHDIRALVHAMQQRMPQPLRRWVHVPLTSYDVIDTARALQFRRAYFEVVGPKLQKLLNYFAHKAYDHADTLQIGRTHGQHALPIMAGFWLASILSRLIDGAEALKEATFGLVGKISGAVGAYNAQVGLGIAHKTRDRDQPTFEEMVLKKLGLRPAPVSTQILPPEPLADYLFACLKLVAVLGQFGEDCRQLMRTEIGEVREEFEPGQTGSSTMAHKRNPINFEGLVGAWTASQAEFGKILGTLISEHQRDLTGSRVSRDFPTIVVNLVGQIDVLMRANKEGRTFLERMSIDADACRRNFLASAHLVMAEPLYIAIQRYGFAGDAHALVNHKLVPTATQNGEQIISVLERVALTEFPSLAPDDQQIFADALRGIPEEVREELRHPECYVGRASEIAKETANRALECADALGI